jgi:hypothetical protein
MWTILKPNHATAYAAIGLALAGCIGYPYLNTALIIPGVTTAIITLYICSTMLGNVIKNKYSHKNLITNLYSSQFVVFVSLMLSIVFGGFINALVAHYHLKTENAASLKQMAEIMNFDYSDVAQVEGDIQFSGYGKHGGQVFTYTIK